MREWAVVTPNFFQAVFLDIYIPSVTTWPEKYMKIKHNNCKWNKPVIFHVVITQNQDALY